VVNNTNIRLIFEELNLLNKGLKHNLSYKNKTGFKPLPLKHKQL